MNTNRTKNIKFIMFKHNVKVKDIANILKVHSNTAYNKIYGKTDFNITEAKTIVNYFNSLGENFDLETLFFADSSEKSDNKHVTHL